MQNKPGPLQYAKQEQGLNVVELTPNRQYSIQGSNGKTVQVRRGTVLVEPRSAIEPRNLGFYEQMLEPKGHFPLCSQGEAKGDLVILTLSLSARLK